LGFAFDLVDVSIPSITSRDEVGMVRQAPYKQNRDGIWEGKVATNLFNTIDVLNPTRDSELLGLLLRVYPVRASEAAR
jgi:hypothetical protein